MSSTTRSIYKQLVKLYNDGLWDELLVYADRKWRDLEHSKDAAVAGDCCRFIQLAYIKSAVAYKKTEDYDKAEVWRARALARFAIAGYTDGIAVLFIQPALRLKEQADIALSILKEMETLLSQSPRCKNYDLAFSARRLLHEKRGYILARVKEDYVGAIKDCNKALEYAIEDKDNRGIIKVRLGIALCHYLKNRKDAQKRKKAIEENKKIIDEFVKPEYKENTDLEKTARGNLKLMLSKPIVEPKEFTWYEF